MTINQDHGLEPDAYRRHRHTVYQRANRATVDAAVRSATGVNRTSPTQIRRTLTAAAIRSGRSIEELSGLLLSGSLQYDHLKRLVADDWGT